MLTRPFRAEKETAHVPKRCPNRIPARTEGLASGVVASALPMLAVMHLAAFAAAFNERIINVALVDIMGAFSVGAMTAQWLVTGYMIVAPIFTACMTFLSGRFSTRGLLGAACACLVVGEVGCLLAPSFALLLSPASSRRRARACCSRS